MRKKINDDTGTNGVVDREPAKNISDFDMKLKEMKAMLEDLDENRDIVEEKIDKLDSCINRKLQEIELWNDAMADNFQIAFAKIDAGTVKMDELNTSVDCKLQDAQKVWKENFNVVVEDIEKEHDTLVVKLEVVRSAIGELGFDVEFAESDKTSEKSDAITMGTDEDDERGG